jgi:hypothetical protein
VFPSYSLASQLLAGMETLRDRSPIEHVFSCYSMSKLAPNPRSICTFKQAVQARLLAFRAVSGADPHQCHFMRALNVAAGVTGAAVSSAFSL